MRIRNKLLDPRIAQHNFFRIEKFSAVLVEDIAPG
jgi:hypothetical protein